MRLKATGKEKRKGFGLHPVYAHRVLVLPAKDSRALPFHSRVDAAILFHVFHVYIYITRIFIYFAFLYEMCCPSPFPEPSKQGRQINSRNNKNKDKNKQQEKEDTLKRRSHRHALPSHKKPLFAFPCPLKTVSPLSCSWSQKNCQ